ncbi:peptidoglycan hydrolase CwlO-like protein [Clostridium acetobutylicum]|uniref:C40 family peptidase n=1 Tax=Clostridium TaxID=1485 RepID=UPI000200A704|nr:MULTISPECIES: NlpC/P60 family protein [Clostridium]ADZ19356.1 Cell wall-associated hydrolase [Clostridium acetobutylicum EA 2018]NOV89095.1 peptidoglycan hydrolase CwlO-like protein [Clostridium acetobutylicum]NOW16369.1 peptidoglycan hydrolase CwlO-like protein [Clostridium acetobutylicum]NRY58051.1 peptidoglycan hydrolase CwlO-like protein [Clostridium acetobutylicum]NSA94794.1 peptidoglycan hydrolase CwlO-like protein [Clostridium acetobutylicum]
MHKRILSTVVAFGIVASMGSTSVFAAPLQDAQSKYDASHKNVQNLEEDIQKMDNQIETIMSQRDSVDKKITQSQQNINQAQNDIAVSKENIREEKDKFADRVRALYISGSTQSYVDILLKSKSFSDMISRIDAIKQISDYDQKLVSNLKDSQGRIEAKKDKIVSEKQQLEALNKENDTKLKQLNDEKSKQNVLIAQAKADESKNAAEVKAEKDAEKAAAQARLVAAANTAASSAPAKAVAKAQAPIPRGVSHSSFAGSGNDVVSFAESFSGLPYIWGAEDPSRGFDCSGLVQYVYGHFGVSLGRTTYEQVNQGTTVTALQPGDLLFFGPASAPYHVAIYAGNNEMVEAPRTGENVRKTAVRGYSIAKRVR